MIDVIARNWGWVALRGAVALVFGVLTLINPAITLAALVLFFGIYAIADGVFTVVSAIAHHHGEPHWITLLFSGVVGVAAGVATLLWPGLTATVLLVLVAVWAIVSGAFEIAAAIRLRKVITGEWLLALAGVLSVVFGVILLRSPTVGALAVALWIGAYAVVLGIVLLALALRLRTWHRVHGRDVTRTPLPA